MPAPLRNGLSRFAVKLFALAFGFVIALSLFSNFNAARKMDFISFWAAGKLVLAGQAVSAYDLDIHRAVQFSIVEFEGLMPFAYPPPFLFVATPLALLPYPVSAIVWVTATAALFVVAARRIAANAGWTAAAFPPVLINGLTGQNGLLTGALFLFGASLIRRHPFRAGLVLGCLVLKPHLGVFLPLAFAAGGHWRAFMGAAVSSAGLALLALLVFGPDAYVAFLEQLPLFSSIAAEGLVPWHKMVSIYASLSLAGVNASVAWAAHCLIAAAAAVMVWLVWRGKAEIEAKMAVLAAASVLVSPYLYLYDTALLLFPFLWLARNGEDPRVLALLWCIPFVVALQNWGFNEFFNPAPLFPIVMIVLIARRISRGEEDRGAADAVATPAS